MVAVNLLLQVQKIAKTGAIALPAIPRSTGWLISELILDKRNGHLLYSPWVAEQQHNLATQPAPPKQGYLKKDRFHD